MDRLALIGVSHRRGGAELIEKYQATFSADALPFKSAVLLSTCNRWDAVGILPEDMMLSDLRDQLTLGTRPYVYTGEAALEQLTRVAASLDSLNPGEDQVMSQVREAFAVSKTDATLTFAFQTALRIAKKVRAEIDLAPMDTSLFSLARPRLEQLLPKGGNVAVLGLGKMGTLAAKSVASLNYCVYLVNRSRDRLEEFLSLTPNTQGFIPVTLESFLKNPPRVDALVCATPIKHLVDDVLLTKLPELNLIIDLGIPRNADAEVARSLGVEVLDVDSLQTLGQQRRTVLADKLAKAERLVQGEVELAMTDWTEKQLGPSIKKLRDMYLQTIAEVVPKEEAEKLAHKFAHVPVKGLRAIAREYGLDAAKLFLSEAGLE
ncbi:MAG: NAD(P)-binding domain-containing protein [Trueperaceae bacterium]